MQGNAAAGGPLVVIARKYGRLFETHAVTGKGDRFVTGLRDTIAWRVSSFHAYGGRSMDGVDTRGLYVQASHQLYYNRNR
jgi:hypothetical protein